MDMETKNEFLELLGAQKRVPSVSFGDGDYRRVKSMLCRGIDYFIGEHHCWLPEYEKVVSWLADNKQKGLMLFGANGRGKSVICRQILPSLMKFYYPKFTVHVIRAFDLSNLNPEKVEYYEMVRSSVIVIDDFGVESVASNYGNKYDVFSNVVDIVEQEKKMLICSTNLSPKEIEYRYGLRTIDRLMAITHPICFIGDSMRNKRQQP